MTAPIQVAFEKIATSGKEIERGIKIADDLIEEELKSQLVISLYGSVNAGKSTAMNAILGKKLSEVGPLPGCTKNIQLYRLSDGVLIADTPGLLDVNDEVAKRAIDYVHIDSDIVLFFISVDPGMTAPIQVAFEKIATSGKEIIIVLSKIDYFSDEPEVLKDIIVDIRAKVSSILPNPSVIPISSKKNRNIDLLQQEIMKVLAEKGKELLFAKQNRNKWPIVEYYIMNSCGKIIGLSLNSEKFELEKVTKIQIEMIKKIGEVLGKKVTSSDLVHFITDIGSQGINSTIYKKTLELFNPFIKENSLVERGVSLSISAAVTYGLGITSYEYYRSDLKNQVDRLDEIFRESIMNYSERDIERLKKWITGKVTQLFKQV
jgi:small GTP-binding protein